MSSKAKQIQSQTQRLTPRQVLQENIMQLNNSLLEQRIIRELEENPTLEIVDQEQSAEKESESSEAEFEWDELDSDVDRFELKTGSSDQSLDFLVNNHTSPKTLSDRIKEQLLDINIPEEKMHVANEIVGNLDDDGYFKIEPALIADRLRIHEDEVLGMLKIIQSLQPRGIASRDLRECMLLQIDVDLYPLAFDIVDRCFDDLINKRYERICTKIGCTMDELNEANSAIKRINPKPGDGIAAGEREFIIPDVIVEKRSGEWIVSMNDSSMLELRVNENYKRMLNDKKVDKEASSFIKGKLLSADWFIDAIRQRKKTIIRVMGVIIKRQENIFKHDSQELAPMIQRDIAEELGLDVSTVSRATSGKYVQLPWGVFEIKDFFSESIETKSGKSVSNTVVKKRIDQIISNEDKSSPLDDQAVTDMLMDEGYLVARRTVSKYRSMLGIPKSKLRREIK